MNKPITVEITEQPFSPWHTLAAFEQEEIQDPALLGACAVFTGTMRNNNEGDDIAQMTLEHYPGMTEKVIQQHIANVLEKFPVAACLVKHRVGEVSPGDTLVLCACWSAHRHQAFRACEEIFEALKSSAPFWKKEVLESGQTRWVEKNTENPRTQ